MIFADEGAAPPTSHVVLIDDDPSIHDLVDVMLRPIGARVSVAVDGESGLALVRDASPDLILLDNGLPGLSGLDVLTQLKADPLMAALPVIMETGNESNRVLTACFAAGAIDYIRKPFTASELRARVGSVLDRQRMLAELTSAARVDKLTGLSNRAMLTERLGIALQRAAAYGSAGFSLMFLDFDRFKLVNDSLGHDVGDQLLRAIAGRLRNNLRSSEAGVREAAGNTVARLGGDEFVVLLEGVSDSQTSVVIADRLLAVLSAPYQLGDHVVRSSASIGIVQSSAGYASADEMLRDADIAMYEAKARGKGCHVAFTPDMRDAVRERLELESALRDAIGTDQFSLDYQAIVSLDDRGIRGVEALARWTHPTRGPIPPSRFIPMAEETGQIIALSEHLLRRT
jgi:diguanylate cyclase (GGDEF)-like protein